MTMLMFDPETHARMVQSIEAAIKGYEGALAEIERQSKLIDELVEALKEYAEDEANSRDERLNLLISKAQSHKPNEGQRDE